MSKEKNNTSIIEKKESPQLPEAQGLVWISS